MLGCALVLGGGAGAEAAQCELPREAPEARALEALLSRLGECQRDAAYLAGIGHFLNEKARYDEAAEHLERALLLEPDLKGAQVDYAIALAGLGDIASAAALVDSLLADPGLPAALRPVLQRQRTRWARAGGTQLRFVASARLGYDSNLLGSPNLSSLALTFPGQTVNLPLDESYRRRSGMYLRTDAHVEARRDQGGTGQWDLFAGVRSRRSDTVGEASSDQIDVAAQYNTYQRSSERWGGYMGASVSALHARTGIDYRATGVSAGVGSLRAAARCDARAGIDLQIREYQSNPVLSGRYAGVSGVLACEGRGMQWLVGAKAGRDRAADAARPGGDQVQYGIRAAAVWTGVGWGDAPQGQLLADADVSVSRDRTGYSALLESGRLRSVTRGTLRVEFQHPLAYGALWVAGAEWTVQHASLALFGSRSFSPYVAVRRVW